MNFAFAAAVVAVVLAPPLTPAPTIIAGAAHHCAGLERAQNDPDKGDSDEGSEKAPDDGSQAPDPEPPQDDGTHSNTVPAPNPDEPPGCVFDHRPLDLLV